MTTDVKNTMTVTEYAKHRGVTTAAVLSAIKKGLITAVEKDPNGTHGNWIVDFAKADQQWDNSINKDFSREKQLAGISKSNKEPTKKALNYYESRAIRELYQARLAKLEFEQRTEKLVESEFVRRTAYDLAAQVRQSLLNIPVKIAANLAAETSPVKIETLLITELRQIMEELADGLGKKLY